MKRLSLETLDLACGGYSEEDPYVTGGWDTGGGDLQISDGYGPGSGHYSSTSFDALFERASQAPPVWGSESRVLNYLSGFFPAPRPDTREEYPFPAAGLRG